MIYFGDKKKTLMQTRKESAYFVAIFLNYIIQNLFLHKLKNKVEIFIFIKCIYRVKKKVPNLPIL